MADGNERSVTETSPDTREQLARHYLRRLRPAIPSFAMAGFGIAWLALGDEFLLRMTVMLGISALIGLGYVAATRAFSLVRVTTVSVFLDIAIVALIVAEVPDPTGAALAFVWSIAVAAVLLEPRIVTATAVASTAAYVAVELRSPNQHAELTATNALVLLILGALFTLLHRREMQAVTQARVAAAQLEAAQAVARLGSWSWNLDDDNVRWSPQMYDLFGFEPDVEITLERFLERLPEVDRHRVTAAIDAAVEHGAPYELDLELAVRGEMRVLHVRGKVFPGRPRLFIGTALDLTAERRLLRLQQEFVATASHELRTPVTVVAGFADTLQERWDDIGEAERRRFIGMIGTSARQLSRIVQDVLVSARIEGGVPVVDPEPLQIDDLVRRVVEPLAQDDLAVELRVDPDAEGMVVLADRDRFAQVIGNLLSNARRHAGAQQPIEVWVAREDGHGVVRVRDHGPGIPPEERQRVFERFVQLGNGRSSTAGTGLGLYVSRNLARAMGGDVAVEDTAGRGATLAVTVPAVPS